MRSMKVVGHRGSAALALGLAGLMSVLILAVIVYSTVELERFERLESRHAVVVYAAGQTLSRGTNLRMIELVGTLGRLGYVETRSMPTQRGQFRRAGSSWDIVLRDGG